MQIIEVGSNMAYTFPWFAWLALAGMVCSTISVVVKMVVAHRERMAMLRSGIDPDAPHRKMVYDDADC